MLKPNNYLQGKLTCLAEMHFVDGNRNELSLSVFQLSRCVQYLQSVGLLNSGSDLNKKISFAPLINVQEVVFIDQYGLLMCSVMVTLSLGLKQRWGTLH